MAADVWMGVGEVAKILGVKPRLITQLFYEQVIADDVCPMIGGRRIIAERQLPIVVHALRRKGVKVRWMGKV